MYYVFRNDHPKGYEPAATSVEADTFYCFMNLVSKLHFYIEDMDCAHGGIMSIMDEMYELVQKLDPSLWQHLVILFLLWFCRLNRTLPRPIPLFVRVELTTFFYRIHSAFYLHSTHSGGLRPSLLANSPCPIHAGSGILSSLFLSLISTNSFRSVVVNYFIIGVNVIEFLFLRLSVAPC